MLTPYLRKADTTAMLLPYFKDADTSLLNLTSRFSTKLNISDTASMLTNYLRSGVASNTYLPLTGGILTGDLRINKSSNSILRLSSADVSNYGKIIFNSNTPGFESNGASIESSGDGVGVDVGSLNFLTGFGTARTNRMTITPSGNVSIVNSATIGGTLGVTGATTLTGGIDGNIKTNGVSGATATPEYIWLGNTFSNGTTRDKLKIYLYNSGTEQYGFSVGGAGDIQYHSNILHDFYIANSKKFSISNTNTTVNNSLTVNNATVLNEDSGDFDTRVESDGNANMVFVDASTDRVGIGTGTPSSTLSVNGSVNATDLSLTNPLPITSGGTGAESASVARTTLGVGYIFSEVTAGTVVLLTSNRVSLVNTGGSSTTQLDLTPATNGRMYMIKNLASGTVVSDASNVIPFNGGSAGTAILSAGNSTPQWCILVADGTNWHIMQRN